MPLKLNVGLAKKVGQPEYGSLSASCHVELDLDQSLLQSDLDGFRRRVRNAFVACRQAVNDELARHHTADVDHGERPERDRHSGNGQRRVRDRSRRATNSQFRAIETIAQRQRIDFLDLAERAIQQSNRREAVNRRS